MRMTEHKRRYLWLAAAVIWMALIFHFSNQKAVKSSEISGSLTYRIAKGIDQAFCGLCRKTFRNGYGNSITAGKMC